MGWGIDHQARGQTILSMAQALSTYRPLTHDEIAVVETIGWRIGNTMWGRWSADDDKLLSDMINAGHTMPVVARALRRTPGAVRKRIFRLARKNIIVRMK